jgi:beta-aspartyl-dipeptidase (metallo-type)
MPVPAGAPGLSAVIVRRARLYTPDPWPDADADVLMVGDRVAAIGQGLAGPPWAASVREVDAEGRITIPGLVDQHVHIAGGGGEGGPLYRTPEIAGPDLVSAGITTVVGVLGTDGVTRSVQGLVAAARALRAQHLHAYAYTGAYEVPTRTATVNARTDLVMIDEVVGIGEIAVSDQRGSHPGLRGLAELAGEARVGGLLGGKAGVLHLHVGDGPGGLKPLFRLVRQADVPRDTLVPTHLNRSAALLGQALEWVRRGGIADFTSDIRPDPLDPEAVSAHDALMRVREARLPLDRVTMSSDAQGSAPRFNRRGELEGVGIGSAATLLEEVLALVDAGWCWTEALRPATTTPARILKLPNAGRIVPGGQADLVVLDHGRPWCVVSDGQVLMDGGQLIMAAPFVKRAERSRHPRPGA